MGLWASLKRGYSEMVNWIVRPPRAEYGVPDIGPPSFRLRGTRFERVDMQVRNSRGLTLECSWWRPARPEGDAGASMPPCPCVVYMHGNSSCRLEALEPLPLILPMGVTMFAFDFAGCGMSEGDSITLGYLERDDLGAVVDFLRGTGEVSTIALWGRSMGAVTALLHGHRDLSIAAVVLDSPFSSLEVLIREIVDRVELKIKPGILVNAGLKLIRSSVLKRNGLDIFKLKPIENVHTCFIPAVFVAAAHDNFIQSHHASDIYEVYAGDKNLITVDGDHNSRRPPYLLDSIAIFFHDRLCVPAGLTALPGSSSLAGAVGEHSTGGVDERGEDAELQQALLMSLAFRQGGDSPPRSPAQGLGSEASMGGPGGGGSGGGAAARLIAQATNPVQNTLPDRRTAADALLLASSAGDRSPP